MDSVETHLAPGRALDSAPLLERDHELAELSSAIAAASRGTGRLLAVEGPAGIGKTRLLGAALRIAGEHGLAPLRARGSDVEQEFAFGIVHQLLGPALSGKEAVRGRLSPGTAALVEQALAPGPPGSPEADVSYAVLHALYSLIATLAEAAPLLLAIDDAHWADPPSLRLVEFLARRLDGLPVVVLITARVARPEGSDDPLGELHREPGTGLLTPRPLTEAAVAELAAARLGAGAGGRLARYVHEATGGNPFLVAELLAELAARGSDVVDLDPEQVRGFGPRRVAAAVLHRVGGTDGTASRLARAVAVLGDGAELRLAAALAELPRDEAERAADELAAAEILAPGLPLRFSHQLVGASVHDDIPPAARERAHRKAAWILADEGAAPERVAAHLLRSHGAGDRRAVEWLRDAARRALAQAAPESAVRYLQRALAEPPPDSERGDVLAELGAAELSIDGAAARAHLGEAVATIGDPLRRVKVVHDLAMAHFFAGDTSQASEHARGAIAALQASGDGAAKLRRRLEAVALLAAVHDPELTALAGELAAAVRERDRPRDVEGRALLALAAWDDARAARPRALAEAAEALRGDALLERDNGGTPMLAGYTLALADRDSGLAAFERGLELAHEQGSVYAFACHKLFAGRTRHLRGDLAEAIADLREGLRASPIAIGATWGESWLADALLDAGDLDAAAAALERLGAGIGADLDPEADLGGDANWLWCLDARSKLLLRRGELRAGLEATLACGRLFAALGGHNPAMIAWRSRAALALVELGEEGRARELAAEELELARAWGAPRALGVALCAVALTGERNERVRLLGEAVDALRPSPARLALAEALCELGAALRRDGRRAAAQPPLREALALAAECGAKPLEARAREELVAAGARPRRAALRGRDALTAAELRVARRAAQGMTNREIAAALFVTRKTVEYHLRNAYRKLQIGSRAELAASFPEQSPADS